MRIFPGQEMTSPDVLVIAGWGTGICPRASIFQLGNCGSSSEQSQDPVLKISAESHALAGVFHGFLTAANVEECVDQELILPKTYNF